MKANPSTINPLYYRKLRALAQRITKQAKRKSWRSFISGINYNTTTSKLWSAIRKLGFKQNTIPSTSIFIYNEIDNNPLEIVNVFAAHLSLISSDEVHNQQFLKHKLSNEISLNLNEEGPSKPFNNDFAIHELHKAITTTNNSAPGLDEFHIKFLKTALENIIQILLNIYNQIRRQHTF